MIDNVHGDNDKTPPPSGSYYVMLHTIYSTRALHRNLGKMKFKAKIKKNISKSSLNKLATHAPNTTWVHRTLQGVVM